MVSRVVDQVIPIMGQKVGAFQLSPRVSINPTKSTRTHRLRSGKKVSQAWREGTGGQPRVSAEPGKQLPSRLPHQSRFCSQRPQPSASSGRDVGRPRREGWKDTNQPETLNLSSDLQGAAVN